MSGDRKPGIERLSPTTVVQVGMMLEVTPEERRRLEEISKLMAHEASWARKGWLRTFVGLHTEAGRIIHGMIGRAHRAQ